MQSQTQKPTSALYICASIALFQHLLIDSRDAQGNSPPFLHSSPCLPDLAAAYCSRAEEGIFVVVCRVGSLKIPLHLVIHLPLTATGVGGPVDVHPLSVCCAPPGDSHLRGPTARRLGCYSPRVRATIRVGCYSPRIRAATGVGRCMGSHHPCAPSCVGVLFFFRTALCRIACGW
ncbi:hypothetical protein C8R46DRAFT_1082992 [Mycena filopes]|nr:hypothetical protein C8R46DRAFT_1082992 [Mycena filopes]